MWRPGDDFQELIHPFYYGLGAYHAWVASTFIYSAILAALFV